MVKLQNKSLKYLDQMFIVLKASIVHHENVDV